MNKKWFFSFLMVLAAVFSFTGVVAAQSTTPPEGRPQNGYVHDILMAYAADKLGLSVEEIEARIEGGETLAQIALAEGVDDLATFLKEARVYVNEQLAAQGITIPGWSAERGRGMHGLNNQAGACTGTCPAGEMLGQGRGFRGGR